MITYSPPMFIVNELEVWEKKPEIAASSLVRGSKSASPQSQGSIAYNSSLLNHLSLIQLGSDKLYRLLEGFAAEAVAGALYLLEAGVWEDGDTNASRKIFFMGM